MSRNTTKSLCIKRLIVFLLALSTAHVTVFFYSSNEFVTRETLELRDQDQLEQQQQQRAQQLKQQRNVSDGSETLLAESNESPEDQDSESSLSMNDYDDDSAQAKRLTKEIYESGHLNDELNLAKLCPNNGTDLKLLILITSAPQHFEARLAIRETWGATSGRRDVSRAFILGRSLNSSLNLALSEENLIYGDLIRGNSIDSYDNLTLKTTSALEWASTHCSHTEYVLKTDDDMFINVANLLKYLDTQLTKRRAIFGRLVTDFLPVRETQSRYYVSIAQFSKTILPPFLTGPAYVISGDVISELYYELLQQVYLKLEDVITTGIVADTLNIERINVSNIFNRPIYKYWYCNIIHLISIHQVEPSFLFIAWSKIHEKHSAFFCSSLTRKKTIPLRKI